MNSDSTPGEFEIISRILAPLSEGFPGSYQLTDDCASYRSQSGCDLVLTKDTLVAGVHFFEDNPPQSIARKALAVNLSDLAAKAADPKVYLMSIALPKSINVSWLEKFAQSLCELQRSSGIYLVGGDTVATPGPLTITITLIGETPAGQMVLRSGAKAGDRVYVTGTIGDSYLGLQFSLNKNFAPQESDWLRDRYLHPQPRNDLTPALRKYANSAMDISDGLFTDFGKLCLASGVGGKLDLNKIPLSEQAQELISTNPDLLHRIIDGGDDYEILATVSKENVASFERDAISCNIEVSAIGTVTEGTNVQIIGANGTPLIIQGHGYDHFK